MSVSGAMRPAWWAPCATPGSLACATRAVAAEPAAASKPRSFWQRQSRAGCGSASCVTSAAVLLAARRHGRRSSWRWSAEASGGSALRALPAPLAQVVSPILAPQVEDRLLALLEAGAPEEEVLACAGELENLRGQADDPLAARGTWDLRLTSSSKFDPAAPLGRRVDGSAPGLEAIVPAVQGALGANDEAPPPPSSSPIQRLVTEVFKSTQVILEDRVDTLVSLGGIGTLRLSATAQPDPGRPERLNFTFDLAYFDFLGFRVPYPVPFQLLGDEAKGWIDSTFVSDRVRVSRGNKGTVFVLTRASEEAALVGESDAGHAAAARPEGIAAGPSVVVLPGLGNDSADYEALINGLAARGFSASVVPVARLDWLRNALGLLDIRWWQGVLEPRPVLDWYLERVDCTVEAARSAGRGGPVVLLGHSAGGWLARVYLSGGFPGAGPEAVRKLVTLGTPHLPPAEDAEGIFDQTRGILSYVLKTYKKLPQGVEGASVGSRYIRGAKGVDDLSATVIGLGYQQVCGEAEVWGDGIVPLPTMRMPDWQWRELEGVWHSPLGAVGRQWYGDEPILESWVDLLR